MSSDAPTYRDSMDTLAAPDDQDLSVQETQKLLESRADSPRLSFSSTVTCSTIDYPDYKIDGCDYDYDWDVERQAAKREEGAEEAQVDNGSLYSNFWSTRPAQQGGGTNVRSCVLGFVAMAVGVAVVYGIGKVTWDMTLGVYDSPEAHAAGR